MEYAILIVCLGAMIFFVLYFILRRIVANWFGKTAQIDRIKEEMERMLVELNHATSRNIDLIEVRVAQLNEMLATVDKRIGLFKREMEKKELGKQVYSAIVRQKSMKPMEKSDNEIITTISMRDKVLNLYHAGFTPAMIANQLQSTIGEVELIISLAEKE